MFARTFQAYLGHAFYLCVTIEPQSRQNREKKKLLEKMYTNFATNY